MRILYRAKRINYANVKYGLLYNWYAATDARNIAPSGWHVPTATETVTLRSYLDAVGTYDSNSAGGDMKETGTTYWNSPNTDADNSSAFTGRGSGTRADNGAIGGFKNQLNIWTSTIIVTNNGGCVGTLFYDSATFRTNYYQFGGWYGYYHVFKAGISIRLLKDSTALSDGETSTMQDNNGYVYPTICIGTQEWMAANLKTTKYRNSDAIPEVTGDAAWAALSTGAYCYPNGDINNV